MKSRPCVVLSGPVHLVHVALVAGQDGRRASELPAGGDDEQTRPLVFITFLIGRDNLIYVAVPQAGSRVTNVS